MFAFFPKHLDAAFVCCPHHPHDCPIDLQLLVHTGRELGTEPVVSPAQGPVTSLSLVAVPVVTWSMLRPEEQNACSGPHICWSLYMPVSPSKSTCTSPSLADSAGPLPLNTAATEPGRCCGCVLAGVEVLRPFHSTHRWQVWWPLEVSWH